LHELSNNGRIFRQRLVLDANQRKTYFVKEEKMRKLVICAVFICIAALSFAGPAKESGGGGGGGKPTLKVLNNTTLRGAPAGKNQRRNTDEYCTNN
jgi:hypothetical protein